MLFFDVLEDSSNPFLHPDARDDLTSLANHLLPMTTGLADPKANEERAAT
jgi:hypothetical protein